MKTINKWLLCGVLVLMTSAGLWAQSQADKEKIKSLKVAFFTEKLSLSPTEAKTFWPLYNEYDEAREALRSKEWKEVHEKIKNNGEKFSETEANKILKRYIAIEREQEKLDEDFYAKLSETFSSKTTLLLFKAEFEFRRKLIREYRSKKGSRMP